jgi:hypothetical protein
VAQPGGINTGGGGGGGYLTAAAGGSGIVALRYPDTYTLSATGVTVSTTTSGGFKTTKITAGTGTVVIS